MNSGTNANRIEQGRPEADEPSDPVAAATHPDPYPYYARLVAQRPFYRDERLGCWVASSAAAVMEVLASNLCCVRPPTEPVPRALVGSPAGEIFRHLVRMNDGDRHCPLKSAIVATLEGADTTLLAHIAARHANALIDALSPHLDRSALNRFMFALPVGTIATLLGVPATGLDATCEDVAAFVDGISPIADTAAVARATHAAARLIQSFRGLLDVEARKGEPTLLNALARNAHSVGRGAEDLVVMNGIGFMSQTYEATAGLIGNTLIALSRRADIVSAVRESPALLEWVVQEVLHADPPTQSTRRFVARPGTVAGVPMQAGDAILVMLAAAGRDPACNPEPDQFNLARKDRRIVNFGSGVHACPAYKIAPLIAQIAVAHLLSAGIELDGLERPASYRRSNHLRVPIFD